MQIGWKQFFYFMGTIHNYKNSVCAPSNLNSSMGNEDNVPQIVRPQASHLASLDRRFLLDALLTTLNNIFYRAHGCPLADASWKFDA